MIDKTKSPPETTPAPEPLPQKGGSYRRAPDGTLTPVEGPAKAPDHQLDQE